MNKLQKKHLYVIPKWILKIKYPMTDTDHVVKFSVVKESLL